jgi:ComF family protein
MIKILKALIDIFFPPECVICSKLNENFLCNDCINDISVIGNHVCQFCGKPTIRSVDRCLECKDEKLYFTKARSFGIYEGVLKDVIAEYKYKNVRALTKLLAQLLYMTLQKYYKDISFDSIEYIPMNKRSKSFRGFNQSELLAKRLGKITKLPVNGFLIKTKNTEKQMSLSLSERRKNLIGAFGFKTSKENCRGNILLIDDVYTTGYTVSECSKVLLNNGAKNVYVLTLARSLLKQ